MLTNVWFAPNGPPHWYSGLKVHPVVVAYRTLSRIVDGVNEMAVHMRQVGRHITWVHTACALALRYVVANAFISCRHLGLCKDTTSMWEWQWQMLQWR